MLKVAKYAGSIVMRLIEVAVTLIVFSNLQNRETVLIIAVLGIIYTMLRMMGVGLVLSLSAMCRALAIEFIHVRGLLGDEDQQSSMLRECAEGLEQGKGAFVVQFVGLWAVSLICLFQIITHLS